MQGGGAFRHWHEVLEGKAELAMTATDGTPAALRAGAITYIGGWLDETALGHLLRATCAAAAVPVTDMPYGLRRRDSATHRFLFNYNAAPITFDGVTIPAAGVHWRAL